MIVLVFIKENNFDSFILNSQIVRLVTCIIVL